MGKSRGAYHADFPAGSRVRVVSRPALEQFMREWRLHNPLQPEQLQYAGTAAVVKKIGYYHGGDELYSLENIPGVWHECCLQSEHVG